MAKRGWHRWLRSGAGLCLLGSTVVAHAEDTELPPDATIQIGNVSLTNSDVHANADGSFTFAGQQRGGSFNGAPIWDVLWDLTLNPEPSIAGTLTLTNLTDTARPFSFAFGLPVLPGFSTSVLGGSVTTSLLDANLDGSATLTANLAKSPNIYRGTIDGVTVLSLFALDQLTCFGAGCSASGGDSDGLPGLTLSGPGVIGAIGTLIGFTLSPHDSVTISTNFTVEPTPVPLPAALPLLMIGLGGFAAQRRLLQRRT